MVRLLAAVWVLVFSSGVQINVMAMEDSKTENAPIKILILDGFSNHDWIHTTECVIALLADSDFCEVDVETAPMANDDSFASWRPRFSDYDVVIQSCNNLGNGYQWPEEAKRDFTEFVRSGGGLYVLHSANNSFPDWEAYNDMIGLGWRSADQGEAIEIKGHTHSRIRKGEGEHTHHGPRQDMQVQLLDEHPITQGYPKKWMTPDVELYEYPRGSAKNLTILSYGVHEASGKAWPMEWVVSYGQGRVYNGTFGHVWSNQRHPVSVQCVGWQTTFYRALQWLASREITYPIPNDFPSESEVSLKPLNFKYRSSDGWQALFNGVDLDDWLVLSEGSKNIENIWNIRNGAIEGDSLNKEPGFDSWLVSQTEFGDFQLRLKFQAFENHSEEKSNSGIQFRSRFNRYESEKAKHRMDGPQVEIHPGNVQRTGLIFDRTSTVKRWVFPDLPSSSMDGADLPKSSQETTLKFGDDDDSIWNDLEIVCEGTLVRVFLNERLISKYDGVDLFDDPEHKKLGVGMDGVLAFQLHGSDPLKIRFKDIWIREL
ncbi:DUF1080 domain-containing protein [Puniceicoccaceae bacterium K14]|nr:DUF1080 domain-containing protein [Puniceicoccaceae bacterium K14]